LKEKINTPIDDETKRFLEDEALARKLQEEQLGSRNRIMHSMKHPKDKPRLQHYYSSSNNNSSQTPMTDEEIATRLQTEEYQKSQYRSVFPTSFMMRREERPMMARSMDTPGINRSLDSRPFFVRLFNPGMTNTVPRGNVNSLGLRLSLLGRDFNENDYETLLKLDETVQNRKGATDSLIDVLPIQKLKKEDETNCCICLNDMTEGTEVRRLPCLHFFHVECIDQWLKVNKCCPIDKKNIDETI